jgi:hypothetical protein
MPPCSHATRPSLPTETILRNRNPCDRRSSSTLHMARSAAATRFVIRAKGSTVNDKLTRTRHDSDRVPIAVGCRGRPLPARLHRARSEPATERKHSPNDHVQFRRGAAAEQTQLSHRYNIDTTMAWAKAKLKRCHMEQAHNTRPDHLHHVEKREGGRTTRYVIYRFAVCVGRAACT